MNDFFQQPEVGAAVIGFIICTAVYVLCRIVLSDTGPGPW